MQLDPHKPNPSRGSGLRRVVLEQIKKIKLRKFYNIFTMKFISLNLVPPNRLGNHRSTPSPMLLQCHATPKPLLHEDAFTVEKIKLREKEERRKRGKKRETN